MAKVLNRRLLTDATKTKVLEEDDPNAAFVIGGKGSTVSDEDVEKYGLDESHFEEADVALPDKEPIVEVEGVSEAEGTDAPAEDVAPIEEAAPVKKAAKKASSKKAAKKGK